MKSRGTLSSMSPSSYSSVAVPSAATARTTPPYHALPPMYRPSTLSPRTRSLTEAPGWDPAAASPPPARAAPSSPPSSSSESVPAPVRSSKVSSAASASSTKSVESTWKSSRPVTPASFLPDESAALALPSLASRSASFLAFFLSIHAFSRSSVTGVRVVVRFLSHSIRASISVGSLSSSFFFSSFFAFSLFFSFFFFASWNSSAFIASCSAFFISARRFSCAALSAPPFCVWNLACTALPFLFFMPNVLSTCGLPPACAFCAACHAGVPLAGIALAGRLGRL
mmetsp:Transcript_10179/g.33487  ORF Transcript_10179/g.33487 Transcript_10179/m.33487 type:complete len:283 (-) Transcript_10179:29-877(-)